MSGLVVTVKTDNGEYQLWKPKGQIGVKHMGIMLKFARIANDAEKTGMEIIEDDRIVDLYEEWCTKVLPHIILKSPFQSFDDIPYDDQFAIFTKMVTEFNMEMPEESFQEG